MDILAYKTIGIITELVPSRRHHERQAVIYNGRLKKFQNVQIPSESQFHKITSERVSNITANELEVETDRTKQFSRGSVLAFGTQVRGFKPGRSRRIFQGEKILSTPSFGEEVKPSVPMS